jgi:glycine oxidase
MTMEITIAGCGIVGATLAYELTRFPQVQVTVVEAGSPGQGATRAALGVCMGAISRKTRGRSWQLRHRSIQRYATLLPELEHNLGQPLPRTQGILSLCFEADQVPPWQRLATLRQSQGYTLELLDPETLAATYPQVNPTGVVLGIYSPQDFQIQPLALTQALVKAAQQRGAVFHFNRPAQGYRELGADRVVLQGEGWTLESHKLVITAGLGSPALIPSPEITPGITLEPVLGQGIRLRSPQPLGEREPVITGHDVHLVPLGNPGEGFEYWLGATVEFPSQPWGAEGTGDPQMWDQVWQRGLAQWPGLAGAVGVERWFGLRPRPVGRSAPVIERFGGSGSIVLATGHYRNGVLLAPGTAAQVMELLSLDPLQPG